MKTLLVAFCLALIPAGLAAQQQPTQAGATAAPPLAAPPAPLPASAQEAAGPALPPALAPNPNALRIFVENLQGPDASQIAGLIEQNLFQSKQVVVTENATNANLILKGVIYRRPVPEATAAKARRRRHGARAATATAARESDSGGAAFINPKAIPDVNSGAGDAVSAMPAGLTGGGGANGYDESGLGNDDDLASLANLSNPGITDLGKYQFRLDLELVDPNGDLIWISSRGLNGPSFDAAGSAVQTSLAPMLDLLEKSVKTSAANQPTSH